MKPTLKIHPIKINFEIPVSKDMKLKRFVYLFILEGKKLHLIDTGVAAAFDDIQEFIKNIGRNINDIQTILLTHSHPDHIGAAKLIVEKTNCKVVASGLETEMIENTELQFQKRPVPGFNRLVSGPAKVDHTIQEIENIELENDLIIQSIPTPGHSAGSTSYFLEHEKILFSGDAILLPGEIPIFENLGDYLQSLEEIKKLNVEKLYSAWDQPRSKKEIPEIIDRSKSYIENIRNTVKKVAIHTKTQNSISFCEAVLKELNQDIKLANPLLLKSFLACLVE